MRKSDFVHSFPGRLVETSFDEKGPGGASRTVGGLAFVPNDLPPTLPWNALTGDLYLQLDRAKTALVRLEGRIESLPCRTILLSAMMTREAQSSSKIENTFASLREIAIAGLDSSKATNDHLDVIHNRRAIEHGLGSPLPLCLRLVREIHEVLISDAKDTPGVFRTSQVCIGDDRRGFTSARFVPPPAEELTRCLREWERFCNPVASSASTPLPDLVRLALAHYQFEAIHPFRDGNGRVGRALVNVGAVKSGLVRQPVCNLSEWVQQNRQEYYDRLLAVSTHGQWREWIEFFITALAEQAELDLDRADRLASLYESTLTSVTTPRNSIMLTRLIDLIFERQALTIPLAASTLGISYTAAQRHVQALERAGFLKQATPGRHDKLYYSPRVVDAIRGDGSD